MSGPASATTAFEAPDLRPAHRRACEIWWLSPAVLVVGALIPVYLAVLAYDFARVVPLTYLPGMLYVYGGALVLALAVGAAFALSTADQATPLLRPPTISRTVMALLLVPTLAAYAIWFGPLLGNPQLVLDVAAGTRAEVRDAISTIPGVTTLTQFGPAYFIAYALRVGTQRHAMARWEHLGLIALLALAVFRAFVWAERLAVIELLLTFIVARMAYLRVDSRRRWGALVLLPVVAPFAVYVIFTASEYFRSWPFYRQEYSSVWAFTLDRIITYYATAVNNGVGVISETHDWPYRTGVFVAEWAYVMPGLGRLLESVFGNARDVFYFWIDTYGRPEFNSNTAYFSVLNDLGQVGAMAYFLVTGYVMGRAYVGYRRGHTFGLLFYPVFVLFLAESLRYSYFAQPRIVPLTAALCLVAWDIRRQGRRPID